MFPPLMTTWQMLFCPFLQKFGSLKAINQTFPKSLYFGLVNPKLSPQPFFFLSFFIKYNRGEKGPGWVCPPPLASMGIFWGQWCCWDAALCAVIYSCIFMPGFGWGVTSMHKEKDKYFPLNCGCASGLRAVQRSRKTDCLQTQGIHPQTQGCL